MAEDDDDDSFGDFTFAPVSNPSSVQFNQQEQRSSWPKSTITADIGKQEGNDDDDEWGDFVETPLGSAVSLGSSSKPFDPFNFFASNPSSQSQFNSQSTSSTRDESELGGSESQKKTTQWVKVKGAIPLSIFGEVEEEEEQGEEKRPGVSDPKGNQAEDWGSNVSSSNYNISNRSNENAALSAGMSYDIIANLYNNNQQINLDNGLGSNKNMSNLNSNGIDLRAKEPISELSGVSLDLASASKKGDLDTLMNLNDQSQTVNIQDVAGLNRKLNSDSGAFNIGFGGWNIDLNRFNMNSDFDATGNINNQSQLGKAISGSSQSNSNGMKVDLTEQESSNFGGWNFDFDGFKPNSNGVDLDFQVSSSNANGGRSDDKGDAFPESKVSGGDDEEDDGWEFKDADSETKVSNGNEKAQPEEQQVLEANTKSKELVNESNGPIDLFSMSNGTFDLFSMSNGISGTSHNITVGMDNKSRVAAPNGVLLDTYIKQEQKKSNGWLDSPVGNAEKYHEDFGEFAAAFEETGPGKKKADPRSQASAEMNSSSSECANFSNGSIDFFLGSTGPIDLFAPANGNSNDLTKVDVNADPSPAPKIEGAHNEYSLETHSKSETFNDQGVLDSQSVAVHAELDDDFGEFTAAFAESAEGPQIIAEHRTGALPLSIFGEEEQEIDGSLDIKDAFLHQSTSYKSNNYSSNSTISINDLISNLYSQAEQVSSVDSLHKPTENGLTTSEAVLSSSAAKNIDDFDNNSWDFKDAFFERGAENGTNLHNNGDADRGNRIAQSKLNRYVDFYAKLINELRFLAKCHLESLKEAQVTTTANTDAELGALIEEIQEAYNKSGPKNATFEDPLGDYTQRESDVGGLLKILQEPEFQLIESEYSLQRKLSLVEKDSRSTIQLIKHAETVSKILSLRSLEEQLMYVSIWSKMISVCAEELRYGVQIWRHSLENNVHSQILTDTRGKSYLLALGEIYRVAIIVEVSAKFYKPWILISSIESSSMYHLLDECHSLWCSSGLEEAVKSISVMASVDGDNTASLLVDSIKHCYDLDALVLENHVFDRQEPLCQLSLLSSSVIPGMRLVEWGGEQCFVKLANLWTNLISTDSPKLPSLCVNP